MRIRAAQIIAPVKAWTLFARDYIATTLNPSHTTHRQSYLLMRLIYSRTKGKSASILACLPQKLNPPKVRKFKSTDLVINELAREGYHKDENPSLNIQHMCIDLACELAKYPVFEVVQGFNAGTIYPSIEEARKDKRRIGARLNHYRYHVSECISAWQIISELDLLQIASLYLECDPVLTSLDSWHVAPINDSAESPSLYSAAAQTYHYDMDWIKFIKFFINLSEVNETHGPFEFVPKTHKYKNVNYFKDGRFEQLYDMPNLAKATGPIGSMLIADTSGIHRDGRSKGGYRQVLQVEFAVSSFGAKFQYDNLFRECGKHIPWKDLPADITNSTRTLQLFRQL